MLEQPHAVGAGEEFALFFRRHAREHEAPGRARLADGGDEAVAGTGERAGALHHLDEHRVEVETRADVQDWPRGG